MSSTHFLALFTRWFLVSTGEQKPSATRRKTHTRDKGSWFHEHRSMSALLVQIDMTFFNVPATQFST